MASLRLSFARRLVVAAAFAASASFVALGCATAVDPYEAENVPRPDAGGPEIIVIGGDTGNPNPGDDTGNPNPGDDTGGFPGDDTGTPATDTGSPTTGASQDIGFPTGTDTYFGSDLPNLENTGDYIEGKRNLPSLPSVSSIDGDWNIDNEIFGSTVSFDIYLNGQRVGSGSVGPSDGNDIAISASFPPIAGPNYTIRFILTSDADYDPFFGSDYIGVVLDTSSIVLHQ